MSLSQIEVSFNNTFSLYSSALDSETSAHNNNTATSSNTSAYFAKKGEPMYMKEMDTDEDGIVSFDEFKDYCKNKGISTSEMKKMVQMGNSYRELMNQTQRDKKKNPINDQVNELLEKINSKFNDKIYAVRGDDKYNEAMDSDGDNKITYKEYVDYCIEHSKTKNLKSDTQIEKTNNGEFKTTSAGTAINAYIKAENQHNPGMFEYKI